MEVTIDPILSTQTMSAAIQTALDPHTNPGILRQLAIEPDGQLRRKIASNPNTPTDLLWQLGVDFPEAILANPIFDLLQLEHLDLATKIPPATLTSLLRCDRVPIALMEYAVNQQDYGLWLTVAYNQHTPSELLVNLAQKSRFQDRELLRAVAAHPNTPAHLLAQIGKIGQSLAQIIAENRHTPAVVLQQLLERYGDICQSLRIAIALHPQIDVQLSLESDLAPTEAAAQSLWLAKQIATTSSELRELADTDCFILQLAVVRNPNTPADVVERIWRQIQIDRAQRLRSMGKDFDRAQRLIYGAFDTNPHTSEQIRQELRQVLQQV